MLAVNQDDHVKNISFLMDRQGKWKLAPAYDITFSYDISNRWFKAHQMTINGKTDGFVREDLISAGKAMGISTVRIERIIEEVGTAVRVWEEIAIKNGIRPNTIDMISEIIDRTGKKLL